MGGKYAAMVFVNVMWGLSYVGSKHALNSGFSPLMLALVRYIIASVVLLLLVMKREGRLKLRKQDILPIILSGIMGMTLYHWLEFVGIKHTSAVNTSLILAAVPIITMIVQAVVDRRPMRMVQIVGAAMSLIGVGCIITNDAGGESSFWGNVLILGAAVVWVAYIFLSRELRKNYTSLSMNTWQAMVGAVTFIPLAMSDPCDLTAIPWDGWAVTVVLAVVCSALCYVLYGDALGDMSPLASAIFINLGPLATMVGGVVLLGETVTWMTILGGGLIIGSIFLVTAGEERA